MALSVTVSESPALLADALARTLADPLADPFTPEVIAVPGDGVRTSLIEHLSARLGAPPHTADGITANLRFMFPGALIRRAVSPAGGIDQRWEPNRLMWAVHHVLSNDGASDPPDLLRCRNIADLFDRYSVHRREMLRCWERGRDVDAFDRQLPAHQRWQAQLWRDLVTLLGTPSAPGAIENAMLDLRAGRLDPDLGPRVMLYGLASLPPPHLDVLAALATRRDVHLFVPVWSATVWGHLVDLAADPLALPVTRVDDPSAGCCQHPLASTWGRAPREAQLMLITRLLSTQADVRPRVLAVDDGPVGGVPDQDSDQTRSVPTALALVQQQLRADRITEAPALISDSDRSIRWYRCHGQARQAEVLRDAILHLLQLTDERGDALYAPRDIAVLCPDPSAFAALIEAAFAGDPEHGVARIPVRLADRSLRSDTPLMEAVGMVLDLIDGRFRVTDVLALLGSPPVQARFGLDDEAVGLIAHWARDTNIAWGLDRASQRRFGLPESVTAHSWRAGLDQLFVGAAMARPAMAPDGFEIVLGPGETVPTGALEADDVVTLGALAGCLDILGEFRELIESPPLSVVRWATALRGLVGSLCRVPDDDVWQWNQFIDLLETFIDDARPSWSDRASTGTVVHRVATADPTDEPTYHSGGAVDDDGWPRLTPGEITRLFSSRLTGSPGRVRFGTGAVTVSSLTAQRAVAHRVVCIVGLDGDLGASLTGADDLAAMTPCVGDRDPRSELRAQLLDALLAARERLIITSSGFDLRSNKELTPSVPLAELLDLIDQTFTTANRSGRQSIEVTQPRHAWSERNFEPGSLGQPGPWSFDTSALRASGQRSGTDEMAMFNVDLPVEEIEQISLGDIESTLRNPIRTLLNGRLGITLRDESPIPDDLIGLSGNKLLRVRLRGDLLELRLAAARQRVEESDDLTAAQLAWDASAQYNWRTVAVRSGNVPPLVFGERLLDQIAEQVDETFSAVLTVCPEAATVPPVEVPIRVVVGGVELTGVIGPVHDTALIMARGGELHAEHRLFAWVRLLALTLIDPTRRWRAVLVGHTDSKPQISTMSIAEPDAVAESLEMLIDLHQRARRHPIPAFARVTEAVHRGRDVWAGAGTWHRYGGFGDADDRWVRLALGELDYAALIGWAPRADESGASWGSAASRLERWAHRIWSHFDASVITVDGDGDGDAGDDDGADPAERHGGER